MMNLKDKKIIIFDLDGTLTESKQDLDPEMAELLVKLMASHIVAVIGGGSYGQFTRQFLAHLPHKPDFLKNLFIFPTSGTISYAFKDGAWKEIYSYPLDLAQRRRIFYVLSSVEKALSIHEEKTYGDKIEDRLTQITYSALGQEAPLDVKKGWDPDEAKRKRIVDFITPLLPGLSIRIGGMTSIDITKKGIDKAYGIKEIERELKTPIVDMVFIGDAFFEGGNDYPAISTGIDCIAVKNVTETKEKIREITA
ncbi:MAG: HAD-IIB family hydrolase [Candidatus Paceibacterota bacterium]